MTTYRITAEHTRGRSVSHPCRDGIYDDPANILDITVDADTEAEAEDKGRAELRRLVEYARPCLCGKARTLGSDAWWRGICVIIEPA